MPLGLPPGHSIGTLDIAGMKCRHVGYGGVTAYVREFKPVEETLCENW